jgi:hypothetical protein
MQRGRVVVSGNLQSRSASVLLIYGLGKKISHILHSVIKEIKDWH